MIRVGIVGASGYGGGELMRILSSHPGVEISALVSETNVNKPPSAAFPGLRNSGLLNLKFVSYADGDSVSACDVVFLAQDNGKAMQIAPDLIRSGKKVVDLSADFRFRDTEVFPTWYGFSHSSPELCAAAAYGLPELYASAIRDSCLVGNPGCYPTASILALAPLLAHGCIDPGSIIIDAKSGVSGAGRSKYSQDYHFPEANESVSAYKVGGKHRHVPEIEQALSTIAGSSVRISFTPHLIPMSRGILATCYANLTNERGADQLRDTYSDYYRNALFVHVYSEGTPATKHTLGSNNCHIGLEFDDRCGRVVVIAAVDNLVKGMAGQAVQNMNLMCGLDEKLGLDFGGMWP
jgi:N-acetyl-gamma-glutamyl-phosphate reductase